MAIVEGLRDIKHQRDNNHLLKDADDDKDWIEAYQQVINNNRILFEDSCAVINFQITDRIDEYNQLVAQRPAVEDIAADTPVAKFIVPSHQDKAKIIIALLDNSDVKDLIDLQSSIQKLEADAVETYEDATQLVTEGKARLQKLQGIKTKGIKTKDGEAEEHVDFGRREKSIIEEKLEEAATTLIAQKKELDTMTEETLGKKATKEWDGVIEQARYITDVDCRQQDWNAEQKKEERYETKLQTWQEKINDAYMDFLTSTSAAKAKLEDDENRCTTALTAEEFIAVQERKASYLVLVHLAQAGAFEEGYSELRTKAVDAIARLGEETHPEGLQCYEEAMQILKEMEAYLDNAKQTEIREAHTDNLPYRRIIAVLLKLKKKTTRCIYTSKTGIGAMNKVQLRLVQVGMKTLLDEDHRREDWMSAMPEDRITGVGEDDGETIEPSEDNDRSEGGDQVDPDRYNRPRPKVLV